MFLFRVNTPQLRAMALLATGEMSTELQQYPEFASVESFVDFLLEDDRVWPEPHELQIAARFWDVTPTVASARLKALGCEPPKFRSKTTTTRGFTAYTPERGADGDFKMVCDRRWTDCPSFATRSDGQLQSFAGEPGSRLKSQHLTKQEANNG